MSFKELSLNLRDKIARNVAETKKWLKKYFLIVALNKSL